MKYRIELKPERKSRFRPFLETDSLDAVMSWLANPPVPTKTRIRGTDGTYHQLASASYHDIIVSEWGWAGMDDADNARYGWRESQTVSTVASMETEEGCRLIERWDGKPAGSLVPRRAYDR